MTRALSIVLAPFRFVLAIVHLHQSAARYATYLRDLHTAVELLNARIDILVERANRLEAQRCTCGDCRARAFALTIWNPAKDRAQS